MPYRRRHHAPTVLCLAALLLGCGDDATEPQTGNIQARVIIDGATPDEDGCLVSVDGANAQQLLNGETHVFGDLPTGTHTVAISNVAYNCLVRGESSVSAAVSANQTAMVSFTVDCPAPGSIQVSTGTAGSSPFDSDGYTVSLDGGASLLIGVSDEVTFPDLAVGEHEVELTGVADNCAVFADNSKTVTVTEGEATAVSFGVACPPFYDHILFMSYRDGQSDFWVMRADGSNQVNLTSGQAIGSLAAWSPDGRKIAFVCGDSGQSDVCVMGMDGSGPVNLTNDAANDDFPDWSPDGTRIAFTTDRDGNSEVYVMGVDGSNPVNLTNDEAPDIEPDWSPDGTRMAFTTWRDGYSQIYVMDADGSNPANITNDPAMYSVEPDWSPDGTQIVYGSQAGGLYVMGADGSNPTLVITGSCLWFPAWSPDGLWIAFSGYCGSPGGYEIGIVRVDGSNLTNLTNHGGNDLAPAWSPGQ